MSRYDDIDSPDYQEFSAGGDGRTTNEEREIERLTRLLAASEKQRLEAVWAMQGVQPGVLSPKEAERLQRLRDYAYQLQNRLDDRPRYRQDYTKARLSALCWAITKISGVPFDPTGNAASTNSHRSP